MPSKPLLGFMLHMKRNREHFLVIRCAIIWEVLLRFIYPCHMIITIHEMREIYFVLPLRTVWLNSKIIDLTNWVLDWGHVTSIKRQMTSTMWIWIIWWRNQLQWGTSPPFKIDLLYGRFQCSKTIVHGCEASRGGVAGHTRREAKNQRMISMIGTKFQFLIQPWLAARSEVKDERKEEEDGAELPIL